MRHQHRLEQPCTGLIVGYEHRVNLDHVRVAAYARLLARRLPALRDASSAARCADPGELRATLGVAQIFTDSLADHIVDEQQVASSHFSTAHSTADLLRRGRDAAAGVMRFGELGDLVDADTLDILARAAHRRFRAAGGTHASPFRPTRAGSACVLRALTGTRTRSWTASRTPATSWPNLPPAPIASSDRRCPDGDRARLRREAPCRCDPGAAVDRGRARSVDPMTTTVTRHMRLHTHEDRYTGDDQFLACLDAKVTGERCDSAAKPGTGIVLVLDVLCGSCGRDAAHTDCQLREHGDRSDELDSDEVPRSDVCASCSGRTSWAKQFFNDHEVTTLRVPSGCAEMLTDEVPT